ncbi:MAG TPA: GAP family protein [Solirubrobacteraceae bacterium]|nr:GAP family protein [Solirubrobacteraceae bacterium]
MTSVTTELVLVSLAAMLSPTTLSFSVLVLVLGTKPLRTGFLFYIGALGATLIIGVIGAFAIGNVAASSKPNTPKTPVAVIDLVAGVLVLAYVVRAVRRPPNRERSEKMIAQISKVTDSPWITVIGAGAALANPGAFLALALKEISETNPTTAQYILEWAGFALFALLPLSLALLALVFARERAERVLRRVRTWLELHARTVAGVILLLLAAALLRNGIAGLTG